MLAQCVEIAGKTAQASTIGNRGSEETDPLVAPSNQVRDGVEGSAPVIGGYVIDLIVMEQASDCDDVSAAFQGVCQRLVAGASFAGCHENAIHAVVDESREALFSLSALRTLAVMKQSYPWSSRTLSTPCMSSEEIGLAMVVMGHDLSPRRAQFFSH